MATETQENQTQSTTPQPELKAQSAEEKFPSLAPLVKQLEKEKQEILKKSEPWRLKRDALTKEIQPMEARLKEIHDKITEIESPRLAQIHNELGALAKAMGGRSMN